MSLIKFYISEYQSPSVSNYQHAIVALAEGFNELDLEFCGSENHWFLEESNKYLINQCKQDNADIAIYTNQYIEEMNPRIIHGKKKVLIDLSDGEYGILKKIDLTRFDLVLRAHYNRHYNYGINVKPWAYGLSNRIIDSILLDSNYHIERDSGALHSFRVDHTLRSYFDQKYFEGILSLTQFQSKQERQYSNYPSLWAQTGMRHDKSYFSNLNRYDYNLAFGGYVTLKPNLYWPFKGLIYRLYKKKVLSSFHPFIHTIYQFDSWRFWEALAGNTIPIHLCFEKWGFKLPINPVAFEHYLPIGFNKKAFKCSIEKLDKTQIDRIARKGREWSLGNYSPTSTAKRFLELVY